MCVPNSRVFQRCQVYDWPPPLFSTKSIWMARFFWVPMWKAPFFWRPGICTYFFAQRFFEAAYPLGITWNDWYLCNNQQKNGHKKIKGQYMNRSTFWMIKSIWMGPFFFKGQVYEWGRFWNTGSHTSTKITPKLPPPPPPRVGEPALGDGGWGGGALAGELCSRTLHGRVLVVTTSVRYADDITVQEQIRRYLGLFQGYFSQGNPTQNLWQDKQLALW